jgi:ribosome-associated protein
VSPGRPGPGAGASRHGAASLGIFPEPAASGIGDGNPEASRAGSGDGLRRATGSTEVTAIATQTQHAPEATQLSGQLSNHLAEQFPKQLSELAVKSLDDDKAEDIVVIDLAGKTSIADYMVVASGRSTRQVGAMAEHLREKLKTAGAPAVEIEGLAQADWVLIDAGDVIIHLFRPEVRSFYNLEKMWGIEPPASSQQAYLYA